MNAVRVKICGITRQEDLDAATAAGADAVGFVVGAPASPRNLSVEAAEKLFRQVPPFVKSVLVTIPASMAELVEACKKLNPDAVQLHQKNLPSAKLIRVKIPNTSIMRAVNASARDALNAAKTAAGIFDAVLLDSVADGQYGGTGAVYDWTLSANIRRVVRPVPLILAGGLNPDNVAEAVRIVQPYAVDVSSGVEQAPGRKDNEKMIEFIKNVKNVKI